MSFSPATSGMSGRAGRRAYILGADPSGSRPRLDIRNGDERPMAGRYVCIATQSTTQAKYWNNPHGSRESVKFLREVG
jgi:autotransporter strand-loop-strand O-heptosyltransferase